MHISWMAFILSGAPTLDLTRRERGIAFPSAGKACTAKPGDTLRTAPGGHTGKDQDFLPSSSWGSQMLSAAPRCLNQSALPSGSCARTHPGRASRAPATAAGAGAQDEPEAGQIKIYEKGHRGRPLEKSWCQSRTLYHLQMP